MAGAGARLGRVSYLAAGLVALGMLCTGLSGAAATRLTMECPAFLVPGHRNEIRYRLATGTSGTVQGTLEILPTPAGKGAAARPLITMPVRLVAGRTETIRFDAGKLPPATARYRVRLSGGVKREYRAESSSEVKAWDLVGCFYVPLTDEGMRAFDEVNDEVPEGYNPDWDPFVDDELVIVPNRYPYLAGIEPDSVTAEQIAVKVWYWDEQEAQAQPLHITHGAASYLISDADWRQVWGKDPEGRKAYDDRGAAFYSLNGVFFTTNPGQFCTIEMSLSKEAATELNGEPRTPNRSRERIAIDKDGRVSCDWLRAVPHKPASAYVVAPPRELTRFERFYPIYRDHIADIVAEQERKDADAFQRALAWHRKREEEASRHESELLSQLRMRAQGSRRKRLDFEGECLENKVFEPSSDACARVFAELVRERLVAPKDLLGRMHFSAELLSPGWIALVRDLVRDLEPQSPAWRHAIALLYRAGADDEQYRAELQQEALGGNAPALYYLFFTRDRGTGLRRVRRSAANDMLLEKLSGKDSKPGIRAVCAAYAAATGRTALAETIGLEVCALPYLGPPRSKTSRDDHVPTPEQDSELFSARVGTGAFPGMLATLFFQVQTEKAFRVVLERSDAERGMRFADGRPVPAAWQRLRDYHLARWELQRADGLIATLKYFEKQKAGGS